MEEDNEDSGEGRGLQGHSNADRRSRSSFTCIKLLFVSDRPQPSIEQLKLQAVMAITKPNDSDQYNGGQNTIQFLMVSPR